MIVDDEQDLLDMLKLMMNKEGYTTEIAYNGADFLKRVDQFRPDLVTLDVMMPGLTTKEILEQLKTKEVNPKIILLTIIQFSDEEIKKVKRLGNIVHYIIKPFELKEFLDAVKKNLNE